MELKPVLELSALSDEFDIFTTSHIIDPQALALHLYTPLPVTGIYLVHGFSVLKQAVHQNLEKLNTVMLPEMEKKTL